MNNNHQELSLKNLNAKEDYKTTVLINEEKEQPKNQEIDLIPENDNIDTFRKEYIYHKQEAAKYREKIGEERLKQTFAFCDRVAQMCSMFIKILEVCTMLLLILYMGWDVKTRTMTLN